MQQTFQGHIAISDYTYDLKDEQIAKYPVEPRDSSKLLLYKDGNITESIYRNLSDYLPENSLLVMNNTKVVEARLLFTKSTGSTIEIFCLEPEESYHDITQAMLQKERVLWKCLVGGAKKWKEEWLNKNIEFNGQTISLQVRIHTKLTDSFIIEFYWGDNCISFAEVLHHAGIIPLPPYLNRTTEEKDAETYQTVYALNDGSVAAPTAGLHFTKALFNQLEGKNIKNEFVTLHVGAGTFKPVKSDTIAEHEMHSEFIDVAKSFIETMATTDRTIFTVGTTSLRTLESLYWMGVKTILNPAIEMDELAISQWEVYTISVQNISVKESFQSLLQKMNEWSTDRLISKTQIMIAPGYTIRTIQGLLTNFHQPQSTLLLLVAALIGEDWKKVYNYALEHDFRFLSYGDGCLLQSEK